MEILMFLPSDPSCIRIGFNYVSTHESAEKEELTPTRMEHPLMKITFAIHFALSSLPVAHGAGFDGRGPTINTIPTHSAHTSQPGSSQMPVIHGFKQQSHHANAVLKAGFHMKRTVTTVSAHCDLSPRIGFNNSNSSVNC